MDDWITVQEAAKRKGVSATTIYSAIERGALQTTTMYGRKLLKPANVDAYEPATYGGVTRAKKPRGPGRKKQEEVGDGE